MVKVNFLRWGVASRVDIYDMMVITQIKTRKDLQYNFIFWFIGSYWHIDSLIFCWPEEKNTYLFRNRHLLWVTWESWLERQGSGGYTFKTYQILITGVQIVDLVLRNWRNQYLLCKHRITSRNQSEVIKVFPLKNALKILKIVHIISIPSQTTEIKTCHFLISANYFI